MKDLLLEMVLDYLYRWFPTGVLAKKLVADPTYHYKTDAKSDLIKIDYCWFQVLFAGPTDTWWPAIDPTSSISFTKRRLNQLLSERAPLIHPPLCKGHLICLLSDSTLEKFGVGKEVERLQRCKSLHGEAERRTSKRLGKEYPETPDQRGEEVSELFIRCGVLLYDPKSNVLQTNFSKTLEGILPLQHHVRCNTVLETSLAVRDPSPLSFGRCASDPRGFDVEKRRTYAEPSRRALPVPITKSSSHRRRVRDPCRAAGAFINSRRSRDHNRAMRRRHDLNWSCGV
ncbi:hypothetical protein YC2023_039793 [Brassica napus]